MGEFENKGPKDVKILPPFVATIERLKALLRRAESSPRTRAEIERSPEFGDFLRENDALQARLGRWNQPPGLLMQSLVECATAVSLFRLDVVRLKELDSALGSKPFAGIVTTLEAAINATETAAGIRPVETQRDKSA